MEEPTDHPPTVPRHVVVTLVAVAVVIGVLVVSLFWDGSPVVSEGDAPRTVGAGNGGAGQNPSASNRALEGDTSGAATEGSGGALGPDAELTPQIWDEVAQLLESQMPGNHSVSCVLPPALGPIDTSSVPAVILPVLSTNGALRLQIPGPFELPLFRAGENVTFMGLGVVGLMRIDERGNCEVEAFEGEPVSGVVVPVDGLEDVDSVSLCGTTIAVGGNGRFQGIVEPPYDLWFEGAPACTVRVRDGSATPSLLRLPALDVEIEGRPDALENSEQYRHVSEEDLAKLDSLVPDLDSEVVVEARKSRGTLLTTLSSDPTLSAAAREWLALEGERLRKGVPDHDEIQRTDRYRELFDGLIERMAPTAD